MCFILNCLLISLLPWWSLIIMLFTFYIPVCGHHAINVIIPELLFFIYPAAGSTLRTHPTLHSPIPGSDSCALHFAGRPGSVWLRSVQNSA